MWNEFLDEAKSERKFHNTPVLVLGQKHSGKRSLVDSLFDVSKTTTYSKRVSSNYTTGKMKLKGLAPILDYSYLNVVDLSDPDYRTHAKLEVYMVEDPHNRQVYKQLQNPQILKKAVVLLMLDFTSPWDFMEQLNSWVLFLQQIQIKAGLSIVELQAMAKRMESDYKNFREAQFDENGQLKKNFQENQQQIDIPLAQGVLQNNLRMPIIVCVNKCDLQASVLRDQSANKLQFVLYHLRKFCIRYGGSLIYTSIKNNSNLSILYDYILHRSYSMSLRYKPQIINEEAIFIPFGYDNPTLLQDSLLKMDVSLSYNEVISPPVNKKVAKEEIIVEEDSEYFKKYMGISSSNVSTTVTTVNQSSSSIEESSISSKPKGNAKKFFQDLLKSNNSGPGQSEEEKKTSKAENSLLKNINKQMNMSKQIKAKE